MGLKSANQPCILFSASCCTASTVESTLPFVVLRSEQWKPSLIPIGSSAVLTAGDPLAEVVASRQGSPRKGTEEKKDIECQWLFGFLVQERN